MMKTKINNELPKQLSYQIANQMPEAPYDYFFRVYKGKISSYQNDFLSTNTPFFPAKTFHSIHDLYMVC